MRRVREMHKRSQDYVGGQSSGTKQQNDPLSRLLSSVGSGGSFKIGNTVIDEDKALVGLLIYILYKQGADIKLLLALGYLLL
ncbi:MAG: hypothetical protein IJ571_07840 [Ruminococcus sp.]|nr:hypothetical protein [Ruminococcus sp.]